MVVLRLNSGGGNVGRKTGGKNRIKAVLAITGTRWQVVAGLSEVEQCLESLELRGTGRKIWKRGGGGVPLQ